MSELLTVNVAPGVKQVGGDHYKAPIQHWDLCEDYDVDYLAAQATRYIGRYDRKGRPVEDLEKAKSFLDRMMVAHRGTRRRVPMLVVVEYCRVNNFDPDKSLLHRVILSDGSETAIMRAGLYLSMMIGRLSD